MIITDDIKVIQFTDEPLRDCIDYGFFGKKSDWNPRGQILLHPIDKYEELENEISLYSAPRFQFDGESTFLRDPNDDNLFIPSNKYKDIVVANRDSAIIEILEHLGVTEYYVKTQFKAGGNFGGGEDKTIKVKGEAANYGSGGIEANSSKKGGVGMHGRYNKVHDYKFNNSSYKLTEESWEEACKIAKQYGLDGEKDINKLLFARKPGKDGSKSVLTSAFSSFLISADLNANLNIAKGLSVLAGMPGIASLDCGLSKLLNFDMEINAEYESIIIYNFSDEPQVNKLLEEHKDEI